MWKVLQAIALFATAGVLMAKHFFDTLGIQVQSVVIIAVGLGITTMLIQRSILSMLAVVLFMLLINLPQNLLDNYGFDPDVLLAIAITILFLPWIQRLASRS